MSEMKDTAFAWTIKHFDMCPHQTEQSLESPKFSIDARKTTTFSLLLFPRGQKVNTDGEIYVSLYLQRHNDSAMHDISLDYELSIFDMSGNRKKSRKILNYSFRHNASWGFTYFCERNVLLQTKNEHLLLDNNLTIQCTIKILNPIEACTTNIYNSDDYEGLSSSLGELLSSGIHSDMSILLESGNEYKVHRPILENRCPNLLKQLVQLEDSKTYSLTLMEAPVLETILKYSYTGSYFDSEMLEKVFIATNTSFLSGLEAYLFSHPTCITGTTEINFFQVVFPWIIRNFVVMEINKELKYRLFSDVVPDWAKMNISLFKTKSSIGNKYHLKFQRLYKNQITFMKCEIKVIDKSKDTLISEICEHMLEDDWVTPIDFERKSMDGLLQDGDLWLQMKIRVSTDSKSPESRIVAFDNVFQEIRDDGIEECITFQKDLKNLYNTMKDSDVILCVGSGKLHAHKAIICSRSEVFQKMFQHDTLEKQTDTVNIEDTDLSTFESLLMYMYCGDIQAPLNVSTAIQIYAAADKYMLLILKEKCREFLKTNIDAENVGDILIFADHYNDDTLKECCYDHIKFHPEEILNSEEGLSVLQNRANLYSNIVNILLQYIMRNNSDEEE